MKSNEIEIYHCLVFVKLQYFSQIGSSFGDHRITSDEASGLSLVIHMGIYSCCYMNFRQSYTLDNL